jgi:tetratricopeptide (TPR) repeat protein
MPGSPTSGIATSEITPGAGSIDPRPGFGDRARARLRTAARACVALVGVALLAASARADAGADRDEAARLVREGRCAAALELLGPLRAQEPADPDVLLLAGTCEIQLRRYDEAVATLREAARRAPSRAAVHEQLAIALYHAGDRSGAKEELDAAVADGLAPDDPQLLLYRGLLLLDEHRSAEAAATLERARARDPRAVEPVASFYAAVAWSREHERARAEADLERVLSEWPGTDWARQAEHLRQELESEHLRRWLRIRLGWEYDDNAVLLGSGTPLPSEISSRADNRGVWTIEGGAELFRNADWSAGALAGYSGAGYLRIQTFDTNYPIAAVWLDRRIDEDTTARLLVDGGFAWVNERPFLGTERGTLSLLRSWGAAGFTELFGRIRNDDYQQDASDVPPGTGIPGSTCPPPPIGFCGPPGVREDRDRDRDGQGFVIGFHHALELPRLGTTIRGGYAFERFDARGRDYTYDAHTVSVGAVVALPWEVALDATGIFTWRPYDHPSSYPNPPEPIYDTEYPLSHHDRTDRYYGARVSLARPVRPGLVASLEYRYDRNRSNAQVFDYEEQVVGAYLTYQLGH